MNRKYFPKGIAKGEQFFGRDEELKRLIGNIQQGVHTLLLAPRRYGKTSLAKKAIQKTKYPFSEIDLFVAIDANDIGQKIISGVSDLIQRVSDTPEQWFNTLKNYFAKANKKWTIGIKGLKLELIPDNPKTVPDNIIDALGALEFLLKKQQQVAIVFIDEVQEISESDMGKAIEGAIRHFAQESEHVVFIFSGSNRHMLLKMFKDRLRPLYALCDDIKLNRIDEKYYKEYLDKIALKTFNKQLSEEVFSEIMVLSNKHPRYVYLLCFEVWLRCEKKLPTVQDVKVSWIDYVTSRQKDIREVLTHRSPVQRKLLEAIALGDNKSLSSHEHQQSFALTSSAIVQGLKVLEDRDFTEKMSDNSFHIIDPSISTLIRLLYEK